MHSPSVKTLAGVALLGLFPAIALAAQPQGTWRGLIQQSNADVAVQMTFVSNLVKVHFNEPLSCDVPAAFLKEEGTTSIYRFRPSINGGRFCDGVLNRDLRVTATSEKQLDLVFDGPRSTWRGRLMPVPSP